MKHRDIITHIVENHKFESHGQIEAQNMMIMYVLIALPNFITLLV